MKKTVSIGVLAFQGDVIEHIETTTRAAKNLRLTVRVVPVRTKKDMLRLDGLIIPGGESTTMYKLCQREGMWEHMKKIPALLGTCAGAIMLAKTIRHQAEGQQTLGRMDIEIDRNAYGRQFESFEEDIKTALGPIRGVFIRAPRIGKTAASVKILAKTGSEILACEEIHDAYYDLATCFHPELSTTLFHEYFIKKVAGGVIAHRT